MNNKIIIIAGFSASGKDTLAKKLEDKGFHFVISHSTRPMREGESDGYPYFFISNAKFLEMAEKDQFIEHRQYNTLVNNVPAVWHYGVHKANVHPTKPSVVVLDLDGAMEFKKYYGDRCVTFFLDADLEERRNRCINRGDYDEIEFNRRYEDDKKKFSPESIKEVVDHVIESYDEEATYHQVLEKIEGEN